MSKTKYSSTSYGFSTCENGITTPVNNKESVEYWKRILSKWEKFSTKHRAKLRVLVRRGIPHEIRGEVWKVMSGAESLKRKNPGVYEILVKQSSQSETCLKKDIHRTFPTQIMFKLKEGNGQRALYNVLKVFSIMDPEVGYCQGMSFLCGVLVNYMSEVDAFWVLAALLKGYNFRGLYLSGLPLLKHYLYRFYFLVGAYMPGLARHLDNHSIRPLYYSAEWFSTLFSYNLPPELTFRIWDVLFLEGPEYLFRIGLAILKISEMELMRLNFEEIMIFLKNRTAELDFGLIAVADRFTGIEALLEGIDKKFELVRETVLAGFSDEVLTPKKKVSGKSENQEENIPGRWKQSQIQEEFFKGGWKKYGIIQSLDEFFPGGDSVEKKKEIPGDILLVNFNSILDPSTTPGSNQDFL